MSTKDSLDQLLLEQEHQNQQEGERLHWEDEAEDGGRPRKADWRGIGKSVGQIRSAHVFTPHSLGEMAGGGSNLAPTVDERHRFISSLLPLFLFSLLLLLLPLADILLFFLPFLQCPLTIDGLLSVMVTLRVHLVQWDFLKSLEIVLGRIWSKS